MSTTIKNGRSGYTAVVDKKNRLHTYSISNTTIEEATIDGESYNINSGLITLTSAGESGILYYKHNEECDLEVSAIVAALGPSTGGATTDTTRVRVYKNVTAGTLVSAAADVDINSNRNFGSTQSLGDSLAYKGAEAATITDGLPHIDSLVSPGNRVSFPINEILKKGNSIAISFEPNDSNTSMKVMAAVICNLIVDTSDT